MNLWIACAVAILIYIYVSYYYRYPQKVSILQSSLDRFDLNLLQEKQPIVLEDAIKDIQEIKKAWFKWNYTTRSNGYLPDQWQKNRHKHLLIHPQESTEILLYPAAAPTLKQSNIPDPNETIVIIKLKPNQLLIVPFHWKTMIQKEKQIEFMGIHDLVTLVLP
jgi:hypothetical protein